MAGKRPDPLTRAADLEARAAALRCFFDDGSVTWRVVRWSPELRDATASTYLPDADTVSHAQQIAADDAGHSLDWEYFRDASGRVVEANSK